MGKKKDNRGFALCYIAEYLERSIGFPWQYFIVWFSEEEGSKDERTLLRYIKGDTPMKSWTFEQFWGMVERTVQNYLKYDEEMGKPLVPHAAETWEAEKAEQEQICRLFFVDLDAPERVADFTEAGQGIIHTGEAFKKRYLEIFKPFFDVLDKDTAYRIQENFPAFAAVTPDDLTLWTDILDMTAEEKAAKKAVLLQGATVDAGTMLDYLQSEEVRCWVDLKNRDYRDTPKKAKDMWGRFCEKFTTLRTPQAITTGYFLLIPMLVAAKGVDLTAGKLEVQLPTEADIELLLLYKYCLTPEERERLSPNE